MSKADHMLSILWMLKQRGRTMMVGIPMILPIQEAAARGGIF